MARRSKKIISAVRGTQDILSGNCKVFDAAKNILEKEASFYNYLPIETPILEPLELFERSTGKVTEIVQKQIYSLITKGGDKLALRPEGTPGIVRAYIEHGLSRLSQPLKLFYYGPMFRHEKPQAGRYRQFYQAGFELFCNELSPIYDTQVILACYRSLESLGIKDLVIQINNIGDKNCRPAYIKKLVKYYASNKKALCADCKIRLYKNPLRLLDCKDEGCQKFKEEAPKLIDYLDADCRNHFRRVLEYLEELKLPYLLNTSLVRGLDYYTRTVFEIFSKNFDSALAGGGRYDYLTELLGGRRTYAVGGAIGMERVIEAIRAGEIELPAAKERPSIFVAQIGDVAKKKALVLIEKLKVAKIHVIEFLGKDSLKAQMKMADKYHSAIALILGQREVYEESIIIRDLKTGSQETILQKNLIDELKSRLKKLVD